MKKRKALFLSTTPGERMRQRIDADFRAYLNRIYLPSDIESVDVFFEHGQWFARVVLSDDDMTTDTYSVVDVDTNGETSVDFEEL